MTDYIVFIHGVNTRTRIEQPDYAEDLIRSIDKELPNLNLKQIPLYWGNVGLTQENNLLQKLKESDAWDRLWFKDFRSAQLMQFVGDAALYISRHVGSKVVQRLAEQIKANLPDQPREEDRLHLITHSWGTVILFDV
jgi:hypothetical protein